MMYGLSSTANVSGIASTALPDLELEDVDHNMDNLSNTPMMGRLLADCQRIFPRVGRETADSRANPCPRPPVEGAPASEQA